MSTTVLTFLPVGLDPRPIRVEVSVTPSDPGFRLVGLAEASLRESRVRVRAALHEVGVELDEQNLTVTLAPVDLDKSGGCFDLAIAIGILGALGRFSAGALDGTAVLGELTLDGAITKVRGVLPSLRAVPLHGAKSMIVPAENAAEAAQLPGVDARPARRLADVIAHFRGERALARAQAPRIEPGTPASDLDLAEIRGQHGARRAMEVAAAGGHNLLFIGPRGCGKTMAARRLPTVLPPFTPEEALAVTMVYSAAGMVPSAGLVTARPFRAPHHTVSAVGLVGGGDPIRPGEVSLAHRGCLFLDEIAELRRNAVEALRQPLDEGSVTICRARVTATFPAQPLLIGASNPCPCGYLGESARECLCSSERVASYRARLPPFFDIQIPLHQETSTDTNHTAETSAVVRERVIAARAVQTERAQRGEVRAAINGALAPRDLARVASVDARGREFLSRAGKRLGLSERMNHRILRVSRTLADLDGSTTVKTTHVAEALQMRLLDGLPGG